MEATEYRWYFLDNYWKYFLQLESEFANTEKYVTFSPHNKKSSSLEYLLLFQAACSEIDTVGKAIAEFKNPSFQINAYTNLKKWGYEVQKAYPQLENVKVIFDDRSYLEPWKNWKYQHKVNLKTGAQSKDLLLCPGKQTPEWWLNYNKVKHARAFDIGGSNTNFILANQINVITSMAALYSLEVLFLRDLGVSGKDRLITRRGELFSLSPN